MDSVDRPVLLRIGKVYEWEGSFWDFGVDYCRRSHSPNPGSYDSIWRPMKGVRYEWKHRYGSLEGDSKYVTNKSSISIYFGPGLTHIPKQFQVVVHLDSRSEGVASWPHF